MRSELIKIKEAVEQFKNTKFNCVDTENKIVYVENTQDNSIYGISYIEKNDDFVFDSSKAEVIKKNKNSQALFLEQANLFKNALQDLFVFDDTNETFHNNLLYVEEIIKNIDLNAEYVVEEVEEKNIDIELSDFVKKFEKPILEYHQSMFDFLESIELFDKDNNLISGIINSKSLNKSYVESFLQNMKDVYNDMDLFGEYMEHIEQYASKPESKDFIRKTALNIKKKGDIPKMCLLLKTEYNEDIDIASATREITNYLENDAPNFAFNYSPAPVDAPKFLNIMTGAFTPNDLMLLANELNAAVSRMYTELTPEKLDLLKKLQQRCDYMVQTQKISDHVMNDIITTFNKAFGKDQSADISIPPIMQQISNAPVVASQIAEPFAIEIELPGVENE